MQATKLKEQATLQHCIFGEDVRSKCPVRQELAREKPDISKWVKSMKNPVFDDAEQIVEKWLSMSQSLSEFCAVCPFLVIYIDKQTTSP